MMDAEEEKYIGGFPVFLDKITWFSFLTLVFSLAFMQPFIYFGGQRLSVSDFIFPVVFLFWLASLFFHRKRIRRHKFYWILSFYFAAMIFSAIFSVNSPQSFVKLTGEIYLLALSVITFNLVRGERRLVQTIKFWLAGTIVAVLIGIYSLILFYVEPQNHLLNYTTYHYGSVPIGNYPRLSSTFVSASMFCNFLNVGFLMILAALETNIINARILLPLLALLVICAVFTISAGLGGFALAFGLWMWFVWRERDKKIALFCLFGGIVTSAAFFLMNFVALQTNAAAAFSFKVPFFDWEFQPSARVLIWQESLRTFGQNFFSGVGLGQDVCRVIFQNSEGTTSVLTDAHNYLLSAAAQNGIFGLLAVIALTIFIFRLGSPFPAKKYNVSVIFAALLAAFVCSFFYQGLTGSFEDARHLWVLIGLILSAQKLNQLNQSST